MLKIYSSLSKQKQEFKPLKPGQVGLYVCGMTVYDFCHIGHARTVVAFDTIVRYLRYQNYTVQYVRNITDIDDKIIARAQQNGEDINALTTRYITAMHEDFAALGALAPSQEPKATQTIPGIIDFIQKLEAKGFAYKAGNNDVYYEVKKFSDYGKLSHRDTAQSTQAGARIAIDDAKKDPLDFVLWKAAKPGEPAWDSPWGPGRPGWHIECSAMSMECLGEQFDIHGGGFDLQFPHHENEIAQTEALTNKQFVNTWIHIGFVQINKEKMSKSLNNFFTIREVLSDHRPEVVRYFLVSSHYRSPVNYSTDSLSIAEGALERFYLTLRSLPTHAVEIDEGFETRFIEAMDDDFNVPEALAVLFDLAREINRLRDKEFNKAAGLARLLRRLGGVLGILQDDPEQFLRKATSDDIDAAKIEALIVQRNQARQDKNWQRADEIREELAQMNILIEDAGSGTTWRRG